MGLYKSYKEYIHMKVIRKLKIRILYCYTQWKCSLEYNLTPSSSLGVSRARLGMTIGDDLSYSVITWQNAWPTMTVFFGSSTSERWGLCILRKLNNFWPTIKIAIKYWYEMYLTCCHIHEWMERSENGGWPRAPGTPPTIVHHNQILYISP